MPRVVACAFNGCKNSNSNSKQRKVSYFGFPKNVNQFLQWKSVCSQKGDDFDFRNAKICSEHFLKEDMIFISSLDARRLKNYAVPKRFPIGSNHCELKHNLGITKNSYASKEKLSTITTKLKLLKKDLNVCGQVIFSNQLNDFIYKCLLCENNFLQNAYFIDHLTKIHFSIKDTKLINMEIPENRAENKIVPGNSNYDLKRYSAVYVDPLSNIDEEESKPLISPNLNNTEVNNIYVDPLSPNDEKEAKPLISPNFHNSEIDDIDSLSTNDENESNIFIIPNLDNTEINSTLFKLETEILDDFELKCSETSNGSPNKTTIAKKSESYSCCNYSYTSKYSFMQHKRKCHNEYECYKCNGILSSLKDLRRHLYEHFAINKNNNKTEKKFECKTCFLKFQCSSNLTAHMRRHEGESAKNVKCNYCDKKFIFHSERRVHERCHLNERKYQCEICGAKFNYSSALIKHRNSHRDEKNYKCLICSKSFKDKARLKDHSDIHITEKTVQCTQCDAKFICKRYLRQHMQIHSLKHKYECKICKKTFSQYPGWYSHMKSHGLILKDNKPAEM